MSEKRFTLSNFASPSQLSDVCDDGGKMLNSEVVDLLNEQQTTIDKLREEVVHNFAQKVQLHKEIRKLKEEEKLYANEIVRLNKNIGELNKTIEEALKFKTLGGDY